MRQSSLFAAIAVLSLIFSPAAVAQVITGSISGTVADETGAVLPGVEVTVQNQDTGFSRTAITDDRGAYRAPSLQLGPYEVRGELTGFQTVIRSGINLTLGREAVVNLTLRVGEITEQVYVTGEAPLVETSTATVADLVDEKKIRDLPLNGRDFIQLAMLQAGVVNSVSAPRSQIGNEGVKISIAGTRTTSTAILLDGTDIRNELNTSGGSASGSQLGVETVREFQVITGVFSAEYGRFTGGVINSVSKSGTNELHGSVFEFHRNSALDARNFFDQEEVPPFKRNQFGFTLGGPIVKDKTFFFGSYEGFRERLQQSTVQPVPNDNMRQGLIPRQRFRGRLLPCTADNFGNAEAAQVGGLCNVGVHPQIQPYMALYPASNGPDNGDGTARFTFPANTPTNEDYYMVKVDHQFSDSDSFFVRYTLDDGDRFVGPRLPIFGEDAIYRSQWTTLEWKRIINPVLINELRFGFTRSAHDVIPRDDSGTGDSLYLVNNVTWPRTFGEIDVEDIIVTLGPSPNQFKANVFNNFQTTDNLIYTRGRHALKFGVDWQRQQFNYVNLARANGIYNFLNLGNFLTARANTFDSFVEHTTTIGVRQNLFGFYVQDDFTARPNLTLNLGLRYEFITVPTEVAGRIGNMDTPLDPAIRQGDPYFDNPSLKNFSPRIGLAWDPFGDGKTSVRAGAGLFFDQILSNIWGSRIQQTEPNIRAVVLFDSANPASFPNDYALLPPADQVKQGPWVIYNPDQPTLAQWSLNLQRELFPNGVLLIGYSGSKGTHLGRFVNSNTAFGVRRPDGSWSFPVNEQRNQNFGDMRSTVWDGNSFYHAMRLSFNKRYSHRHQFQISYSWSKLVDESSASGFFDRGSNGDTLFSTFIDDHRFDRGPSGLNITHAFTTNYTVDLPGDNLSGVAGHILGGWQAGGILTYASGEQITIIMTFDRAGMQAGTLAVQRPDRVPGEPLIVTDRPDKSRGYVNLDALDVPRAGYLGNLGRGPIVGPGRFTADLSLVKKIPLGGDANRSLQFRAEFFNIFNNVNLGRMGTRSFTSPRGGTTGSFGNFRGTVDTSRQIQFALKIAF
jgi:hypothetical protein